MPKNTEYLLYIFRAKSDGLKELTLSDNSKPRVSQLQLIKAKKDTICLI